MVMVTLCIDLMFLSLDAILCLQQLFFHLLLLSFLLVHELHEARRDEASLLPDLLLSLLSILSVLILNLLLNVFFSVNSFLANSVILLSLFTFKYQVFVSGISPERHRVFKLFNGSWYSVRH
jgi:hypothetical protein